MKKIGSKIRKYRREKNMTLEELSEKSGVALATLSRMENGKMPGTVKAHTSICKALGISIADLYRELEDSDKTIEALPDEKRPESFDGSGKIRNRLLIGDVSGKTMLPMIMAISPGAKTTPHRSKHGSERFLYALKGSVTVQISENLYTVKKGDSLYFDPSLEHSITNCSSSEAEIISVTYLP